jgi:hypothetical protein
MIHQAETTDRPDAAAILDMYFLEARARLIELAAMLDRVDRAPGAGMAHRDPRMTFIHTALEILHHPTAGGGRARAVQELYSLK